MNIANIERTMLSSIMFDNNIDILDFLNIDDFMYYDDIFRELLKLKHQKKPLHRDFIGEEFGEKLLDIEMQNPVTNWRVYADSLKNASYKRMLKKQFIKAAELIDEDRMDEVKQILSNSITPVKRLSPRNFSMIEAQEPDFICTDFMPLPRGAVSIISAAGSTGKTWIALHLQNIAAQKNLRSLGWYSEDSAEVLKGRLDTINKMRYFENNALCDVLDSSPIPITRKGKEGLFLSDKCYELMQTMKNYDLVIIDPLVNFLGAAGENNNDEITFFLQPFIKTAKDYDLAIVFLHHSKKNSEDGSNKVRGASAITNSARIAYEVEKIFKGKKLDETKKSHRIIKLTKDNLGAYRHFGGFEREFTVTPDSDFGIKYKINDEPQYNFDGFKNG